LSADWDNIYFVLMNENWTHYHYYVSYFEKFLYILSI